MTEVRWDLLANLGQNAIGGYQAGRQFANESNRAATLQALAAQYPGQLPPPATLGAALLSIGDMQGAMTAARLAQSQAEHAIAQKQWEASHQLAVQQAQKPSYITQGPEVVALPGIGGGAPKSVYRGEAPQDRALREAGATPEQIRQAKAAEAGIGPSFETAARLAQSQADLALRQQQAQKPSYVTHGDEVLAMPGVGGGEVKSVYRGESPEDRALREAGATPEQVRQAKAAKAGIGPTFHQFDPDKPLMRVEGGTLTPVPLPGAPGMVNVPSHIAALPPDARKAALAELGKSIGENFSPRPTEKMKNEAATTERAVRNITSEINNLESLIDKHGVEVFAGPAKTRLETSRTHLITQLKDLEGLGVLNVGDLPLLNKMVVDPTASVLDPKTYGNLFNDPKARAKANFAELRRIMATARENANAMMRPGRTTQGGQNQGGSVTRDDLLAEARRRGMVTD